MVIPIVVGGVAIKILSKFMVKFVPRLIKTKNAAEGKELLWSMLRKEAVNIAGYEGAEALYNEMVKETKITYEDGKVCIKYRKFKRCSKGKGK